MKKLHSKPISVSTTKINSNVTKEMVDELLKYSSSYIKKSLVQPIDNTIVKIYDDNYNKNYYKVNINEKLLIRFKKIYKITKNEEIGRILDIIQICRNNMSTWKDITEEVLVEELTVSIDKEILKSLMINSTLKKYK